MDTDTDTDTDIDIDTSEASAPTGAPDWSIFDYFGGYYAVLLDGAEVARFAPSPHWSQYANSMEGTPGFSYTWVPR